MWFSLRSLGVLAHAQIIWSEGLLALLANVKFRKVPAGVDKGARVVPTTDGLLFCLDAGEPNRLGNARGLGPQNRGKVIRAGAGRLDPNNSQLPGQVGLPHSRQRLLGDLLHDVAWHA